ncbi:hypothetical protein T484DRAFT_1844551 [Baffinella frigidus]|nr:hypothetical protein T484DRAFT_1844551 [Cryptophyta sp. CCMP2293]
MSCCEKTLLGSGMVWPGSHEHVEAIVKLANEHNVVVIPFGGGTSVSGALVKFPIHEEGL